MPLLASYLSKLRQSELLLQTCLSVIVRILAALSLFFVSLVIGRKLGAGEAGYFFLAFSICSFLAAISRIGLDNTVLRFTGAAMPEGDWGVVQVVLNRALYVTLTVSIPVATGVYLFSDSLSVYIFDKPHLAPVLQGIAPGIVGLSLFTLIAMSLQGLRKIVASVVVVNIFLNVLLILIVLVIDIPSAAQVARVYSGAALLTVLFGLYLYFRSVEPGLGSISWAELFQSCMPLWIVVLMSQLTQFSGQFIAGAWVSSQELAQLAVAQRTALLTSFILMAVNIVVAPQFASMYKKGDMKELEKLALTSVKLMGVFALPIVLAMLLFSETIMGFFGEGFSQGSALLKILVIGQFINVITGSVGYLLTMSGHEKDYRNTVLISGPLALILGLSLVPMFGSTGSAIATAIAIASQNLIAVWWVRKRLGFNTLAVWKI